jgi:P4 family phage/plasmid primase-like protien
MNKQKYLLPLKGNKIIDLRTNEVRKITINDYFDYECPVTLLNLTTEEEEEMRKYFEDLFCDVDTTQCFLDIIKSCITGETHRYVYFWVGKGSNGKSLILELIQKMFGKSADVISKDVVLQKKGNTHLTTEFEKLDKTRFGFVTELEESDVLNEKTLKAISGGDPIDTRGICKTNETIYPTANINIITNELPKFKVAKAICDRIKMFPFDNVFEPNLKFKNEMLTKLDLVFSYIIKRGVVREDFNFTERMNKKADEYKESNRIDFLEEFVNTMCIRQGTMKRDDFITEFNKWQNETENEDKVGKNICKRLSLIEVKNIRSHSIVWLENISLKS